MEKLPRLVQRIRVRKEPWNGAKGAIDRLFEFDYMGASEFEWGALPRALKLMREQKTKDWKVESIYVEHSDDGAATSDIDAYFVGHPDTLKVAEALLRDQLGKKPQHRTKEITSIRVSFGLAEPFGYGVYDGWWAIDAARWTAHGQPATDDCPFVIFRKKEHAEAWLKAMCDSGGKSR